MASSRQRLGGIATRRVLRAFGMVVFWHRVPSPQGSPPPASSGRLASLRQLAFCGLVCRCALRAGLQERGRRQTCRTPGGCRCLGQCRFPELWHLRSAVALLWALVFAAPHHSPFFVSRVKLQCSPQGGGPCGGICAEAYAGSVLPAGARLYRSLAVCARLWRACRASNSAPFQAHDDIACFAKACLSGSDQGRQVRLRCPGFTCGGAWRT